MRFFLRHHPKVLTRLRAAGILAVALVAIPAVVLAQAAGPDLGLEAATSIGLATTDIRTIVGTIINAFLGLLGIIAVILVLYAGFLWMTAGGDAEKVKRAKQTLISAVIGLVIIISSYVLASFIIGAITGDTGTGTQGCPVGQVCGSGGGGGFGGGGAGAFRVTATTPAGAGPNDAGWPKNYSITVSFNAAVSQDSVTPATFDVRRCNARVSGSNPSAFSAAACGEPIAGTFTVEGSRVLFRPSSSPGGNATDFEGDFWYKVRLQGGAVRDGAGRTLLCPFQTVDVSSAGAGDDYCERGIAFNLIRDVEPPTVALDAPASPPAYCSSALVRNAQVVATAKDDFLVAGVDFLLDGGSAGLVDGDGLPMSTASNGALGSPFRSDNLYVNLDGLTAGAHRVTAIAKDGVPLSSGAAEKEFSVVAPSCCNAVLDTGEGETAIDCGGQCGSCSGGACTSSSQCASGFCNSSGRCEDRPVIQSVSPLSGGVGSLITVTGASFGTAPGSIVFLGSDSDGDGNPEGDADDVVGSACAPQAWSATQVAVSVPSGAVSGPIKLIAASGATDRSDDDFGPGLGSFNVGGAVVPGICYLSPVQGLPGTKVSVNGVGLGATAEGNQAFLGANALTPVTCAAGETDCGWSDTRVWVTVPPVNENVYPVKVLVSGGIPSNFRTFLVSSDVSAQPRITAVIPESGPAGSYVTIQGSGFRNIKGTVRFKFGQDVAIAGDPVCDDNWHDNYIVVKVPEAYNAGLAINTSVTGVAHSISVVTSPPARTSNADVSFGVTDGEALPGICSITPDNGKTGTVVTIRGEGFGNGPGSATAAPRHAVEFFRAAVAQLYSSWTGVQIGTVVPGETVTGPVRVVANNRISANAIPFLVQDCNASGAICAVGTSCCASGSCQASCQPESRDSAYGWRFSTNVIPTLPTVVERPACSASAIPAQPQSPSPYGGSVDACRNASLYFEFSRPLDTDSFDAASVKVVECGTGSEPICAGAVPLQSFISAGTFTGCDGLDQTKCRGFETHPAEGYDGGTHFFKRNTWYRVTLVSNPSAGIGLREAGADGRYLDGDNDRRQGGDYVSTFRVRDNDSPCQLANVMVLASSALISQDQDEVDFAAGLTAGNCNILQCGADQPYAISWNANAAYLNRLATSGAGCVQPVLGVSETPTGVPTPLTAEVTPTPVGSAPPKQGSSQVTVKYAEPRVIAVTPAAACTAACINSAISAEFNLPMDSASLTNSNVEIKRCRNASCAAPFEASIGVAATVVASPSDGTSADGVTEIHRHVTVQLSGNLEPNTFYLVRIRGGFGGVVSRSGVALSGLNDGQYYSWSFRTKDDPTACSVARTSLNPANTTLRYVGERVGLVATAYGSPDACADVGQQLRASAYNWDWDFDAPKLNPVLQGFIDGISPFTPLTSLAKPASVVDTAAFPRNGCSANCLLTGSQNVLPQCGNSIVESKFEECDDGNANDADGCTNQCILRGNPAPFCGNGVIDAGNGEACEAVVSGGTTVWPLGCKQPGVHVEGFADNLGCVFTGASAAARSTCGDGLSGDGEACDDGNAANGDGCSNRCLKEGTLRSCAGAALGTACVNFCGNGIDEPGEDPACDPNPAANGCNVRTCLKVGTAICPNAGSGTNCCGNGVVDAGEDAACETDPDHNQFCSDRCLIKGSSAFYSSPSFCGDGIVGTGEKTSCEPSDYTEPPPIPKIDAYQVVAARPQAGFDATSVIGSTSSIRSTVSGVPDASAGRANVRLACNCKNEPAGAQDSYCSDINPPSTNNLACADSGCCTARPLVTAVLPTQYNSCRNAEIRLTFGEEMNDSTIAPNMLVGYNNGSAPCPAGSTALSLTDADGSKTRGFWQRVWNGIAGFVRRLVISPAIGSPPALPSASEQAERYCSVDGIVSATLDGPAGSKHTVVTFSPRRALPANKYIRIRLNAGVKSASGTPIAANGYTAHFGTSNTICTIAKVSVTPPSVLLSTTTSTQTVVAHGLSASGQPIVPTLDYAWDWSWDVPPLTSAVVLAPQTTNLTQCSLSVNCSVAGGCPCTINATTCNVPSGQQSCAVTTLATTGLAEVRVRGGLSTDKPAGVQPRNTSGAVAIEARANLLDQAGIAVAIGSTETTGTGSANVMLCRLPWPTYQTCTNNQLDLPWLAGTNYCQTHDCSCTADTWFPFFDPDTNVEFSYCRDAAPTTGTNSSGSALLLPTDFQFAREMVQAAAAAGTSSAAALPCLRENPARVLSPAAGILREHLFTFATAGCEGAPTSGPWSDDAIGLRIATNPSHVSADQWYRSQGFTGSPTAITVDGYSGIREGRTVYVNAAAKTDSGNLYTNVNVMSHSDGADPATTAIYEQILGTVDFDRNAELRDIGICRIGRNRSDTAVQCNVDADCRIDSSGNAVSGRETYTCDVPTGRCKNGTVIVPYAGITIGCDADVQCQVDAAGEPVTARAGVFACDAPKSKLIRDTKRWADLQTLRSDLIRRKQTTGSYPTLDAGTFLRAQTNSAWPSWNAVLGAAIGSQIPADPLNKHGICTGAGVDRDTCWNAQALLYQCPKDSHVYEYRSVGGADFQVRNDFEYKNVNSVASGTAVSVWSGNTCVERTSSACNPTNDAGSLCKKTCNSVSVNAGSSCLTTADCSGPGASCNGPCNYTEGKIFVGGGTSPFPSAWCTGTPVGASGKCGDGILSATEQCEVGQKRAAACTLVARPGAIAQVCNSSCQWVDSGTCQAGACGDGIVNGTEKCDEGSLNGTYGHCDTTCSGIGFSCGDGKRQPNEACDCKDQNGQYAFNGKLASKSQYGVTASDSVCRAGISSNPFVTSAATCSWDCSQAGPRCGDNVINTGETCDGGFQEFKGYCSDVAKTGCNVNADCPNGTACGNFCPTPEQRRRRDCQPNSASTTSDDANACTWAAWTCTAPGTCGNGISETGEECDDGNTNNTDSCIIDPANAAGHMCKKAVCGDGYVAPAEECDNGSSNGSACSPQYGLTCNYCSSACRVLTSTGGFCGDSKLQDASFDPPPPSDKAEQCDGTLGMSNQWICVEKNYLSYGIRNGFATCGASSCQRTCTDPDYAACQNVAGPNTDGDTFEVDGVQSPSIYDICDPDDDNDGVPDANDCAPKDKNVHPAYHLQYVNTLGNTVTLDTPAAPEFCDGVDNDCNGVVDEDWVVDPKPGERSLSFEGNVVDAFFPDQVPVVGAKVIVQRGLCSVDRKTKCTDNTVCGGGTCNSFGKCTNNDGLTCTSDNDCAGANGVCGIDARVSTTDASGHFTLSPAVREPTAACPMKIQVNQFKPSGDLAISYLSANPDELEERSGRGYFSQALPIPPGSNGTIFYDGDTGHEERILLIPVPRPGTAVLAFIWSGALPNYLDAHLSIPGTNGGSTIAPNPIGYSQPGGNLDASPWSRLICDSAGDDSTSCNNFNTSPELMLYRWNGPTVADNQSWKFYIDDYGNVGGNIWRSINGKRPYVIGGYNNGVGSDPNSIAGGTIGPIFAPSSGYGKYWQIINWTYHAGAPWSIDQVNSFRSTPPNQASAP